MGLIDAVTAWWTGVPHAPKRSICESDKRGLHFKNARRLYCNSIGCLNLARCHGLCKKCGNVKRNLGYKC